MKISLHLPPNQLGRLIVAVEVIGKDLVHDLDLLLLFQDPTLDVFQFGFQVVNSQGIDLFRKV